MFGFFIGLVIGAIGYFTGGGAQAALWTSMFWLGWYGLWQSITGIITGLAALGITGGGAAAGGSAGGLVGGLLGAIFGGMGGLLIAVGWILKSACLVGGSYMIYTASVTATTWDEVNFAQWLIGGILVFVGAAFFGSSRSSSSSDD